MAGVELSAQVAADVRGKLEGQLSKLQVRRSPVVAAGALQAGSGRDLVEQASDVQEQEMVVVALNGNRGRVTAILVALRKLDEGSFGSCEQCDQPIDVRRLLAIPEARYCLSCQEALEADTIRFRRRH